MRSCVRRIATALEHLSPDARNGVTTALQTMIEACIATKGQDRQPKKNHSHPPVSERRNRHARIQSDVMPWQTKFRGQTLDLPSSFPRTGPPAGERFRQSGKFGTVSDRRRFSSTRTPTANAQRHPGWTEPVSKENLNNPQVVGS